MSDVAALYDTLKQANTTKGQLFAIHKRLNYQDDSISNLYDYILKNYDIKNNIEILDCGCGVGFGTLLLAQKTQNKVTGISVSSDEIDQAKKNLSQDLSIKNADFICQSFDDLKPNSYDFIIAIESLKHSPNIEHSLKVVKNALKPGGQLIIIEDVLHSSADGFAASRLKQDWVLKDLYNETSYMNDDNAIQWAVKDITPMMYRSSALGLIIKIVAFEIKTFFDSLLRKNTPASAIFRGGFYQDWLYSSGKLRYKILKGKKL